MILKQLCLSLTVTTLAATTAIAEQTPVSLAPKASQQQANVENYPLAGQQTDQAASERTPSTLNAEQHAGAYRFPATRPELEQAASDCEKQVQALWSERNNLDRYRQPIFQRSIGEALQRCRKLRVLAETIKLADEQLYTYQQSLGQAERCFSAG